MQRVWSEIWSRVALQPRKWASIILGQPFNGTRILSRSREAEIEYLQVSSL
jgi:hypothetical protein